jgi:hypothetical protein
MSDRYSYLLKFIRKDCSEDEEQYYNNEGDAEDALELFKADDSGLYECIELIKVDWYNRRNTELDRIDFEEA